MRVKEKQELFLTFFQEDGYRYEWREKSQSIVIEYEEHSFCIYFTETDEDFILIEYPYFWPINSPEEKMKALNIANDLNCQSKGKIIVINQ